jgi:hypothetical protein
MSSGISPANSRGVVPLSAPLDLSNQFVCPYCGSVNDIAEGNCPQCTMENSPAGRKATKARIGPWYVLQKRNPAAPGMKYETLLTFVRRGRVKAHSIVRGPTTHQLWRFAAQVRGLSREFGLCYSCGSTLAADAAICPQCNRPQSLPAQPDAFLESMDGEPDPVVYRELPANAAPTDDPSGNPEQVPVENPVAEANTEDAVSPVAAAPSPEESPTEQEFAEPPADSNSDMIIPSLPEDLPSAPQRPTGARERLAQARRQMAFGSLTLDPEDPQDSAFDDGPPRPPRQIGPAFLPGPRPPDPPRRKRTWIEGAVFVVILLAAVGSGLLYVDPHLQSVVDEWVDAELKSVGVHVNSKPSDLKIPPVDTNAMRSPIARPVPNATEGSSTPTQLPNPLPPVFAPPSHTPPVIAPVVSSTPALVSPPAQQLGAAPVAADSSHAPVQTPAVHSPPAAAAVEDAPPDVAPTPDANDDDPFAKARTLRRRAIDAENGGDYSTAVSLFQQIKDLPREVWPGDLELRLRAAKANAEGKPLR